MDSEPIATCFFLFAHSELRHGLFCDWFSGVIKMSENGRCFGDF